ncbi:transmembrane protein 223 [Microplitis mediator]|uniref:transmembrane protein 223 n=1 Tax=Microplitis mediator TaxID=375433 RepID=UPI0025521804|nr:transmembrane protein 223 [Microplitis mediator]
MSLSLLKIFSKSKTKFISYSNHVIRNVKYFQTLQSPCRLRNNDFLNKNRILKPRVTINIYQIRNNLDAKFGEVNTNVANNVLLYKYEAPRYFIGLTILSVFQFILFTAITIALIDWMPRFETNESIFSYCKRNFLIVFTFSLPFVAGLGSSIIIWVLTVRSIKYIILHKGGNKVTLFTYHPWKKDVQITVPVNEVFVKKHREELVRYMTLALKDKSFYYLLNNEGIFVNPELYDYSIGYYKKKE